MELDFSISTAWNRSGGESGAADVDATDLRYRFVLGDVVFRDASADLSARWGWIPLVDFAMCLKDIDRELRDGSTHAEFEFTESDAKLFFARCDDQVTVRANYALGEISISVPAFARAVQSFVQRLRSETAQRFPNLATNFVIRELCDC